MNKDTHLASSVCVTSWGQFKHLHLENEQVRHGISGFINSNVDRSQKQNFE